MRGRKKDSGKTSDRRYAPKVEVTGDRLRLEDMNDAGAQRLVESIVKLAVDDWRYGKCKQRKTGKPAWIVADVERFFLSG